VTLRADYVLEILQMLTRKSKLPAYVHCLDGTNVTGLIIACLRRLQVSSRSLIALRKPPPILAMVMSRVAFQKSTTLKHEGHTFFLPPERLHSTFLSVTQLSSYPSFHPSPPYAPYPFYIPLSLSHLLYLTYIAISPGLSPPALKAGSPPSEPRSLVLEDALQAA
jgi:hypothetical protein